jgi:Tfp pilus assembly protein PilE
MNNTTKIWIRVVVIVGILAWPAVETYRLLDTTQKLTEAQALERSVRVKLEAARAKNVQVAGSSPSAATPGTK